MRMDLARALANTLPRRLPNLFNPYADRCAHDLISNTPDRKLSRLAQHLDCDAQIILVAEAPGYQGARHTGLALSSERLLMEGAIPRVDREKGRITDRRLPFSEPSATICWKQLYALGLAESTILWNAVQMHPHPIDNVWANRTPTDAELAHGAAALRLLAEAFPRAKFLAVGRKSEQAMAAVGIAAHAAIRHPANGGATLFAEGLAQARSAN